MPVQWNEQNLKRLLLAVFAASKVDGGAVATAWQQLYGSDGVEVPTRLAIIKQIRKLKKSLEKPSPDGPLSGKIKGTEDGRFDEEDPLPGPSRTMRDDSEVVVPPSRQHTLSVKPEDRMTASAAAAAPDMKREDKAAEAAGQSNVDKSPAAASDVPHQNVKVEEDDRYKHATIVIDDSDSATEGRFVTPRPVGTSHSAVKKPQQSVPKQHESTSGSVTTSTTAHRPVQLQSPNMRPWPQSLKGTTERRQAQRIGNARDAQPESAGGKKRKLDVIDEEIGTPKRPKVAAFGRGP
ncbi:hypothetical protein Slin14017_G098860 [Septoria linicola]|nr:hypothetical protein Slin14017_G098860 [Septoria linicola]